MSRVVFACLIVLVVAAVAGPWRSTVGLGARAQETPGAGASEADAVLDQVRAAHATETALLGDLAIARRTEVAAAAATTAALASEVTAAEATVAALQTRVAELESFPTEATTPAATGEVGLNEVAQAGAWDFTVTGVQRGSEIEVPSVVTEPYTPRGIFLAVGLTVVNAGTEADYFDLSWFRVVDDRGRTLPVVPDPTNALRIEAGDFPGDGLLQPGLPYETVLVFDLPTDATGLTLRSAASEEMIGITERKPAPFAIRLEE